MCTAIKDVTPRVRQAIGAWLQRHTQAEFTVAEASNAFYVEHSVFAGIDHTKAASNELIRLETIGCLESRKGEQGDGCGSGRIPRVYKRVYDVKSLGILQNKA
jgi:hypothetical protein